MRAYQGGQKKPAPKNPVGKKGQEIWDGPGTTYVPRQDLYINKLLKNYKVLAKAKIELQLNNRQRILQHLIEDQ